VKHLRSKILIGLSRQEVSIEVVGIFWTTLYVKIGIWRMAGMKAEIGKDYPLRMAEKACKTLMNTYKAKDLPPTEKWHYHQGVFLYGMYRVWEATGKCKYFQYIKDYYDFLIDEEGNFLFARDELDSIQPGILLFPLYEKTGEKKYLIAAKKLRNLVNTINKTSEQGFWHKDKYPYQMWLDGLFMAGPFLTKYSDYFHEPELIQTVLYQEKLMTKHMCNKETGLLYHAWDEKKEQPWSNPKTGCSPEVWGRSAGWYGAAIIDILELLEGKSVGQEVLIEDLKAFISTMISYQDKETGLWYQIIDKGDRDDNWLESSCSSLFIYIISKALKKGYVDNEKMQVVINGYTGLIKNMVEVTEKVLNLNGICIGTSAGTYDYYVSRPVSRNDLHGMGAFILASIALYDLLQ